MAVLFYDLIAIGEQVLCMNCAFSCESCSDCASLRLGRTLTCQYTALTLCVCFKSSSCSVNLRLGHMMIKIFAADNCANLINF